MNRTRREAAIRLPDQISGVHHVISAYVMGQVDQFHIGVDAENHALHDADERVRRSKIGGECNDAARHATPLAREFPSDSSECRFRLSSKLPVKGGRCLTFDIILGWSSLVAVWNNGTLGGGCCILSVNL